METLVALSTSASIGLLAVVLVALTGRLTDAIAKVAESFGQGFGQGIQAVALQAADIEEMRAKLELLPATYEKFYRMARSAEERTRKAIERAEDDGIDAGQDGLLAAFPEGGVPAADDVGDGGLHPVPEEGANGSLPPQADDFMTQAFFDRINTRR